MADNPLEIPQTLRDASEQNLKRAHAEYEQLMDLVTKTMAAWTGVIPPNPMVAVFKDVQGCALHIARENAESVFTFAGKISNALTPQDIGTLQTQFAQDQMQALVTQTQQLFNVIEEAVQKSERGTMGAWMGAMPSNPMAAGFKDVQDRAVAVSKQNAESAFALVEKIATAQNLQDILIHQTRFAQEQTQELHRLIGEYLQKLQHG